ncbi:hypothetical protein ACFPTR_05110 [Aliibacillus thermotolerans]|uniref:Uncharacterized protein n=1 Tax=Aliibacillus thermotolerans TaxID=1834418 RepID=A0ABW0U661_9BACI|nr:hypothetical protein [Aliibacillus thermotolerans]MDA3130150.1 hypothetical protein [Aliibacillus thermotolerans]
MKKWGIFLLMALFALFPSTAFAAEATWSDAEPLFLVVLSIISIVSLIYFIFSMIRNH